MKSAVQAKKITPPAGDGAAQKVKDAPLRLRFRAWWDGRSLRAVVAEEARRIAAEQAMAGAAGVKAGSDPAPAPAAEPEPAPEPDIPWPPSRIAIHEAVFGPGCVSPGGVGRLLDMISPFGLKREVNVLEMGSRLGGAARAIALQCDAWVTGYEPDAALAKAAMDVERCNKVISDSSGARKSHAFKVKLSDKARIHHADLTTLELKPSVFDCAFAVETLHRVEQPTHMLEEMFLALKPKCPLLLTDLFVVPGKEDHPDLLDWLEKEPVRPRLMTVTEAEKALSEIGYDLRVSQDVTAQFREDLFADLRRFIAAHREKGVPRHLVAPLLKFAEAWARRVMALDAGLICVHKLVGLRTME